MASEARDISAKPTAKQIIAHNGKRYTTIREGLAYILVPETANPPDVGPKTRVGAEEEQSVFYNPIQQFNRDLSVLVIKAHGKEVTERRTKSYQKRLEHFANKKRKRQERKEHREDERPAKVGKLSEAEAGKAEEALSASGTGTSTETPAVTETATEPKTDLEVKGADGTIEKLSLENSVSVSTAEPKPNSDKAPTLKILDALSATGLRALRYAHELPFPVTVTSNDLLDAAVESIKLNIKHNGLEGKIVANRGNALAHMYALIANELDGLAKVAGQPNNSSKSEKYDVIDLDPYGTAATFLDAAVQAVRDDGGLLCVTCTDPGVWASNGYPEKAFALYGGIPVKAVWSHEAGLRLILHAISTSAARYGLAVEPLLSLSIDYYARVFVRVTRSPASVKFQAGKTMVVYNCDSGCGAWETQLLLRNRLQSNKKGSGVFYKHGLALGPTADRNCEHCNHKMHIAGPMYAGRLHSPKFVQRILDDLPTVSTDVYGTTDRIRGMLVTALEELMEPRSICGEGKDGKNGKDGNEMAAVAEQPGENGNHETDKLKTGQPPTATETLAEVEPYPFFFVPSMLAKVVHCVTPDEDSLKGALRHLGYRVTRSHCKPGSIKTDAPWSVIWEVMREWVRQKCPVKEGSIKPGTAGDYIMKNGGEQSRPGGKGPEEAANEGSGIEASRKPEVVFDVRLGREQNKAKLVRYQVNPRENWGPMNRATGKL